MDTQENSKPGSPSCCGERRRGGKFLAAMGTLIILGLSVFASRAPLSPAKPTTDAQKQEDKTPPARAEAAAKKFLDSLDDKQRAKALLEFNSPRKAAWSNLPVDFVPRNGVRMGDLNKDQHAAALELLAAVLSKEGYQKIIDIMDADQMLTQGKGGKGGKKLSFGKANYYLAIFGKPSTKTPWFVQFGGHHLGLNVTVVEKNFVLTPTHTGTQPESFQRDGKKVRPLGPESDLAFELINSLDEKQRPQALLQNKVKEMILGPGKDNKKIEPSGIKGAELTAVQQAKLLELIGAWVNMIHGDAAAARMAEIKADVDKTYFAWSGPTAKGSAAYFRIQGPTVVIEFAPQGSPDHIHTVIRDFTNDYGQKLIKR